MESGSIWVLPGQDAGPCSVHWLPVKTPHSGPCKIDEFFHPSEQPSSGGDGVGGSGGGGGGGSGGTLEAYLRGRQLIGCSRALPEGYSGVVAAPTAPDAAASADERAWCSTATFGRLVYWNHDAAPAASDWQARALDFLALADKVHAPVDLQAVEEELAAKA